MSPANLVPISLPKGDHPREADIPVDVQAKAVHPVSASSWLDKGFLVSGKAALTAECQIRAGAGRCSDPDRKVPGDSPDPSTALRKCYLWVLHGHRFQSTPSHVVSRGFHTNPVRAVGRGEPADCGTPEMSEPHS